MSFAGKPFSAIQRTATRRPMPPPPPWSHQQRRGADGSHRGGGAGSDSGVRLTGWPEERTLQRRVQAEVTFEYWCAPPGRRRPVAAAAVSWRPSSPTEAALALIILPLGYACPGPPVDASALEAEDAAAATTTAVAPEPQSPSTIVEIVNIENEPSKPPLPRPLRPQAAWQQQQQQQKQQQQTPGRPPPDRQRGRLGRPLSAGTETPEQPGPREQLLRLARLSYTHSDLATRRLLKSSLLHRGQEPLAGTDGGGGTSKFGSGGGGGFLTRQRLSPSSELDASQSSRMWQTAQCLLLPPLVPN